MDLNHRPEKLLSPTELRRSDFARDISVRCKLSRADLVISQDFHEIGVSDLNRPLSDVRSIAYCDIKFSISDLSAYINPCKKCLIIGARNLRSYSAFGCTPSPT